MIYVDLHMAQIQKNIYVFPKIHLLVLHVSTFSLIDISIYNSTEIVFMIWALFSVFTRQSTPNHEN